MSGERSPLRVALVCHRHHLGGHQGHVYHALAQRFILTQVVVEEDGWRQRLSDLPEGGKFDAILWRARFQELRHQPPFNWQAYPGPHIMLDHDTCRNYPDLWTKSWNSDFRGAWPSVIHHQGFDFVLAAGKRVCELLRDDGVPAVWIPKAYAANWLFDTGPNQPYPNGFTFAPDAMLKNFEVAAAGTAPFCDPTPDLADLGFLDGRTAVVYSIFNDLVDWIHAYLDQPDQLREIGRRAANLVRARHTWDHRVAFLEKLLRSPTPPPQNYRETSQPAG